jgi:hypothetical protein
MLPGRPERLRYVLVQQGRRTYGEGRVALQFALGEAVQLAVQNTEQLLTRGGIAPFR